MFAKVELKFFLSFQDSTNAVVFKKVAVVEYFFNIIFKNHCIIGSDDKRHIGQKRTYRKVGESQ